MITTEFLFYNFSLFILVLSFDLGMSGNSRFKVNRFVLLSLPVLSLLAYVPLQGYNLQPQFLPTVVLPVFDVQSKQISTMSIIDVFLIVYLMGAISIASLFIFGSVRQYLSGKPLETKSTFKCYLIPNGGSYSFFNRIFLVKEDLSNPLILKHEEAHLEQNHSLDLLFVNVVSILLWFNPIVWRWKVLVRQNHEYLADEAIMSGSREQSKEYIHLLLDRALDTDQFSLGNYFSLNSLISKRITMLNKKKKQKGWKTLAMAIIMVGSSVYISACNKNQNNPPPPPPPPTESAAESESDKIFEKVDVMPEFVGGNEKLYAYLGSSITYPEDCKKENIEGVVHASFVIDKNGKVTDVKIVKSVHQSMDTEVLRVISGMPDWSPGVKDGKKVKVMMKMPINFKMPATELK